MLERSSMESGVLEPLTDEHLDEDENPNLKEKSGLITENQTAFVFAAFVQVSVCKFFS